MDRVALWHLDSLWDIVSVELRMMMTESRAKLTLPPSFTLGDILKNVFFSEILYISLCMERCLLRSFKSRDIVSGHAFDKLSNKIAIQLRTSSIRTHNNSWPASVFGQ